MTVTPRTRIPASQETVNLIILDSTRMGAQLLANALRRERFSIAYTGANTEDAITSADRAEVALLVAGSNQQSEQACHVARKLRAASRRLHLILVSEDASREVVVAAFRAGIRGIFSRPLSLKQLRRCILAVHGGQVWANNKELSYVVDALTDSPSIRLLDARGVELLSRREADVVRGVSEGLTNREIADRLNLSENTVKNYLFRIFDKLGISSRVELTLYAVSNLVQQTSMDRADILLAGDVEELNYDPQVLEQFVVSFAKMHRDGRDICEDPAVGYKWFLIAQKIGAYVEETSQSSAMEFDRELSGEQRAEAEIAAERWLREHGLDESDRDELDRQTRRAA